MADDDCEIMVRPLPGGWQVQSTVLAAPLVFFSEQVARTNARALGRVIAATGQDVRVCIFDCWGALIATWRQFAIEEAEIFPRPPPLPPTCCEPHMSDVVHVDQRFRVAFKRLGRTFEGVYWVEDGQVRLTSPYGDAAREKRWSTPSDVAIQMLRELVRRALDQPGRATQNLSARD